MLIWQFEFDTSGEVRQLHADQTIDYCPFFNNNKSQKTQEKHYYISRFFLVCQF